MVLPAQAQSMDAFSFGMLCVWVLFEKYLSGIVPLPDEARWAERYFQGKGQLDLTKHVLKDLKNDNQLLLLIRQLVLANQAVDDKTKQVLERLFAELLSCDPENRKLDSEGSFSRLRPSL